MDKKEQARKILYALYQTVGDHEITDREIAAFICGFDSAQRGNISILGLHTVNAVREAA